MFHDLILWSYRVGVQSFSNEIYPWLEWLCRVMSGKTWAHLLTQLSLGYVQLKTALLAKLNTHRSYLQCFFFETSTLPSAIPLSICGLNERHLDVAQWFPSIIKTNSDVPAVEFFPKTHPWKVTITASASWASWRPNYICCKCYPTSAFA